MRKRNREDVTDSPEYPEGARTRRAGSADERSVPQDGRGTAAGKRPMRADTMELERELGSGVRSVMAAEEDPKAVKERKKKQRRKSYVYYAVSYFFVLIFLMLIGYLIYFNVRLRDGVMRSPYNKRQDAQAKYVKRGDIVTIDGEVIATTETDDEGEEIRVYPEGRQYAHVVGYHSHGKSGVESIANYELLTSNESIVQQVLNDFAGKKNDGDTVVTTLDADLQEAAYDALGDYQGAAAAIDPATGAIRAMVSKPDFDPNTIVSDWNDIISEEGSSVLVNRATQGRYAPGSTFKIITALAYLRKFGTTDAFSYECTGEIEVDGHTIHCAGGAEHGMQNFDEAFRNSCNCAFAKMGTEIGAAQLRRTAESLLFNTSLPAADLQSNASSFSLDSTAGEFLMMQTAFGQGKTLVSPFHMALIASMIAEDGLLMEPYLIDHVESIEGTEVSRTSPAKKGTYLSAREAGFLRDLMRKVVTEGTAYALSERSYTAYGKTGSAEYGKSDGTLGTHSWFTGYAEMDGQKLVVAVIAEGAGSGREAAVPIAQEIFDTWADNLY